MDFISAKIRIVSVFAGILIAGIATLIILGVMYFMFGTAISIFIIGLILGAILVIDIIQWLLSPYFIGMAYRLTPVPETDPQFTWLIEIVRKVAQNNNQKMPRIYIAEVDFPNAFAYGSPIAGRRLAITKSLTRILNHEEIEAVVGHEIGHLRHRDVELLMAIGLIPTIVFYLGYMLLFSGRSQRQSGNAVLIAIALMVVSFLFSILILGVNRLRETYADVNAAKTVDGGAGNLQTALAKIVSSTGTGQTVRRNATSGFSNMLLFSSVNDVHPENHIKLLEEWRRIKPPRFSSFFSDHPHPARRIQLLENYRER
ncbi:MAG: zinc metalloprotease HtpX [Candidatus Thermoplasmatota archaeon]|nr:zinc metalloprotease HtpX [Candidatus Thermoplasmatota archaeon]MDA8142910.1 zinc metalloprotease HtpX [Thermoplasmatales archaeon]